MKRLKHCWMMATGLVWLVLAGLLAGCGGGNSVAEPTPTPEQALLTEITFSGSTTMELLVEQLAPAFNERYPDISLSVTADGSSFGIADVQAGEVDVGMSSRPLTPQEQRYGITINPVAMDAIAVIVHPANPVENLTMEELRAIFTGDISNWQEVGGNDAPIQTIIREETSGTRVIFDALVMDGAAYASSVIIETSTVVESERVAIAENAIGYMSVGHLDQERAHALKIDGVAPDPIAVATGDYPLQRPLLLLTGPLSREQADTFIDFALSATGQRLILENGWVPIRQLEDLP